MNLLPMSDVAKEIYEYLEDNLVETRSMKKTHVFLFDEAQVLLEKHYQVKDFFPDLFECGFAKYEMALL
jgi:hypothetical protein